MHVFLFLSVYLLLFSIMTGFYELRSAGQKVSDVKKAQYACLPIFYFFQKFFVH